VLLGRRESEVEYGCGRSAAQGKKQHCGVRLGTCRMTRMGLKEQSRCWVMDDGGRLSDPEGCMYGYLGFMPHSSSPAIYAIRSFVQSLRSRKAAFSCEIPISCTIFVLFD